MLDLTTPSFSFLDRQTLADLPHAEIILVDKPLRLTSAPEHGAPIVGPTTGQILGHRTHHLVKHQGHPVAELHQGGAVIVDDGHLTWPTLVRALNALKMSWYDRPIKFHTQPDRTNARGHIVSTRSLWMQIGGGSHRDVTMIGQYSQPVSYPK